MVATGPVPDDDALPRPWDGRRRAEALGYARAAAERAQVALELGMTEPAAAAAQVSLAWSAVVKDL